MLRTLNGLLALSFFCLAPMQVWARCEGAVVLSTLLDAYQITLSGSDDARKRAAKTLLVVAGSQTGERLGQQINRTGVTVDIPRLAETLEHARSIATETLRNSRPVEADFQHGLNVSWLAELVVNADCQDSAAHASLTPSRSPDARARLQAIGSSGNNMNGMGWAAALIFAAVLVAAGVATIYLLRRSTFMRQRQVERLPRFPISLVLEVTFTSPSGELEEADGEALDISQGGLKMRWDEPPPPGTLATITLLGIQRLTRVIWSNPHYAGVMFENPLTKAELKSLKETHAPA